MDGVDFDFYIEMISHKQILQRKVVIVKSMLYANNSLCWQILQ